MTLKAQIDKSRNYLLSLSLRGTEATSEAWRTVTNE